MNALNFVFVVGFFAIGFIAGILIESIFDFKQTKRLKSTIRKLKLENQALISGNTEIIEIVDSRTAIDNENHDYFKPF